MLWKPPYYIRQYVTRHQSHFRLVAFDLVIGKNTITCLSWNSPYNHWQCNQCCINSTLFFYRWGTGEMVCHGDPWLKDRLVQMSELGETLHCTTITQDTSITFHHLLLLLNWMVGGGAVYSSNMGHHTKGWRLTRTSRQHANWYRFWNRLWLTIEREREIPSQLYNSMHSTEMCLPH